MLAAVVAALGLAASVVHAAPSPLNRDMQLMHTVTVEEALPTAAADLELGAGVGYAAPTDAVTTTVVVDITEAPTVTMADEPAPTEAAATTAVVTDVPEATPDMPVDTAPAGPVAPVVPVNICTNNGTNCLTTLGSEFADVKLSWDNVAKFSLGPDGLLVRLNDLKCVDAVPMDDATWYDMAFVDCTLPTYLQAAVAFEGNGITEAAPEPTETVTADSEAEPTVTNINMERKAQLTAAVEPTSTEAPEPTATESATEETAAAEVETHTIWFYNTTTKYLCANVNDGLNDIQKVCIYSDEGYALLGTEEELKSVPRKRKQVTMPVALSQNISVADHLLMMLEAMTYDGEVFWAQAWDTNIVSVMKYRMMSHQSEEIMMDRDQMNGVIYPLWQVINDCRSACDSYAWCRSFTFPITERVCRLSDAMPVIKTDEIDMKHPDTVTFVQNKNYNREDYVLPGDIRGVEDTEAEQQQ